MKTIVALMFGLVLAGCSAELTDTRPVSSTDDRGLVTPAQKSSWEQAEAVWHQFSAEHLARARQQMPDADLEWIEYRSASTRKFLPHHRICVLAGYRSASDSAVFALARSGQIAELGQGTSWSVDVEKACYEPLSAFLASQNIVLDSPQRAVACARMVERLSVVSDLVAFAQSGDVPLTGDGIFEDPGDSGLWQLKPRRTKSAWVLTSEYDGPPLYGNAAGPIYELTVDDEGKLVDVGRYFPFVPPADGPVAPQRSWVEDGRTGEIRRR